MSSCVHSNMRVRRAEGRRAAVRSTFAGRRSVRHQRLLRGRLPRMFDLHNLANGLRCREEDTEELRYLAAEQLVGLG